MKNVQACFNITFTEDMYSRAADYVEDMKRHKNRVYWIGKEGKSDEELILSHIAHKILSGFYNNYDPTFAKSNIVSMDSRLSNNN